MSALTFSKSPTRAAFMTPLSESSHSLYSFTSSIIRRMHLCSAASITVLPRYTDMLSRGTWIKKHVMQSYPEE